MIKKFLFNAFLVFPAAVLACWLAAAIANALGEMLETLLGPLTQ